MSNVARFAGAFAPKTRAGPHFCNLIIKTFAIPGLAKLAVAGISPIPCSLPTTHS